MIKTKTKVILRRFEHLVGDENYQIIKMIGHTQISIGNRFFRVGDYLTESLASKVCAEYHTTVTI